MVTHLSMDQDLWLKHGILASKNSNDYCPRGWYTIQIDEADQSGLTRESGSHYESIKNNYIWKESN